MRILLVGGPLTGHLYDASADTVARGDLRVVYLPDARRVDVKYITYRRTVEAEHNIPIFKAHVEEPREIVTDHFNPGKELFYAHDGIVYHGSTPILQVNDGLLPQGAVAYLSGKIARGLANGSLLKPEPTRRW